MQTSPPPYPSPKSLEGDELRLLTLSPGRRGSTVECSLTTAQLSQNPNFEALSYAWGASTTKQTICLHGTQQFPVTDNLSLALQCLRFRRKPRVLWVDALCINQQNVSEREQQVTMMYEVYSTAKTVVIFLGETSETPAALLGPPLRHSNLLPQYHGKSKYIQLYASLENIMSSGRSTWWTRCWVLQELIASPSRACTVCIGSIELPWQDFINWIRAWDDADPALSPGMKQMADQLKGFDLMRQCHQVWPSGLTLTDPATLILALNATEPRDRVYSLLGLCRNVIGTPIAVDYHKPIWQLYAEATHAAVKGERDLRALSRISSRHRYTADLPTWAVDFEAKTARVFPNKSTVSGGQWPLQGDPEGTFHRVRISSDAKLLTLPGRALDEIERVCEISSDAFGQDGQLQHFAARKLLWAAVAAVAHERPPSTDCFFQHHIYSADDMVPPQKSPQHDSIFARAEAFPQATLCEILLAWDAAVGVPSQFRLNNLSGWETADDLGSYHSNFAIEEEPPLTVFVTKAGFIGIGTAEARPNDVVALLHGSGSPAILGRNSDEYVFRGFVYVHGVSRYALDRYEGYTISTSQLYPVWWQNSNLGEEDFVLQ